jgi:hypothetical protein
MAAGFKISALLFLAIAATASAATFLCTTEEDLVALVSGACERDTVCRFEIVDNPRIHGPTWQDQLRDALERPMQTYFEPDTWVATAPVTLGVNATTGVDCAALAADLDAQAPPTEVLRFLALWVYYENYVADHGQCSDVNEVAVLGPDGVPTCQCAPNKNCQLAHRASLSLLVVAVLAGLVALAILAVVIGHVVTAVRRAAKKNRRGMELLEKD